MDDSITAVLEKVQKLRRLATSPNPHEAALAKVKAQEVLSRAGLDESWMRAYRSCARFPNPSTVIETMHTLQALLENEQASVSAIHKESRKLQAILRKRHPNTKAGRGEKP